MFNTLYMYCLLYSVWLPPANIHPLYTHSYTGCKGHHARWCYLLTRTITIHTLMEEPAGAFCALPSYPWTTPRTAWAGDLSASWATAAPIKIVCSYYTSITLDWWLACPSHQWPRPRQQNVSTLLLFNFKALLAWKLTPRHPVFTMGTAVQIQKSGEYYFSTPPPTPPPPWKCYQLWFWEIGRIKRAETPKGFSATEHLYISRSFHDLAHWFYSRAARWYSG